MADNRTDANIIDAAMDAAIKEIQDRLGVTTGDVAGVFWTGDVADRTREAFAAYIRTERLYSVGAR